MQSSPTHAALVLTDAGHMRVERVPTRTPRSGEILVAPLRVGICGSDLDILRGSRPASTRILGHEGVARVAAVGPGVTRFAAGEYVTFLPNNPSDPKDILGVSTEGLNQQYLLIPPAALERGMVVALDPGIPLVCGPLLEPFATVLYGQRLVRQVCKPESLVVVGAGPIGLLNALYATAEGCARVFLVETSQPRLDWAVQRGIVDASRALLSSPRLPDVLLERTAGRGVDAAYLCTPRAATRTVLAQALRYVREEGCIDLTAGIISRDELPELPGVDLEAVRQSNVCGTGDSVRSCVTPQGKRLWLTGQSGASAEYLGQAATLVREAPASYARVISHIASYPAVPRIIPRLLAAEPQDSAGVPFVKVIVDVTREGEELGVFDPATLDTAKEV